MSHRAVECDGIKGFNTLYFATATASSNCTDNSFDTPSPPMVTPVPQRVLPSGRHAGYGAGAVLFSNCYSLLKPRTKF